jgi:aryl-alcohol dehydrogenase-like predicted oxidoreductase
MKTVQLGNTGVEVSRFCLGAMRFGWDTDPETSFRLLDMYVGAGGSFLDTANIYGRKDDQRVGSISETLLGEWMRDRRSLLRLGLDTIDLYYAHVDDRNTPMEETLGAFDRLVNQGKVRFIGASNFLAWRLEEARWVSRTNGCAEYCCIQQRHSYVRPKPGEDFVPQIAANDDLLDYCRARGVTLLAYSPLLSGAYTRPDRPFARQYHGTDTAARLAALNSVAEELGATQSQVVLAWMAQSDPAVIPLVAASTVEQMDENLGALSLELSAEQMDLLNSAKA